jgi:hypothetical protein
MPVESQALPLALCVRSYYDFGSAEERSVDFIGSDLDDRLMTMFFDFGRHREYGPSLPIVDHQGREHSFRTNRGLFTYLVCTGNATRGPSVEYFVVVVAAAAVAVASSFFTIFFSSSLARSLALTLALTLTLLVSVGGGILLVLVGSTMLRWSSSCSKKKIAGTSRSPSTGSRSRSGMNAGPSWDGCVHL